MSVDINKNGCVSTSGMEVNKNLCIDSLKDMNNSHTTYDIADYNLSESLVNGTAYTITAKINMSAERKSVGFYLSGGSYTLIAFQSLQKNTSGIYSGTFTANSTHASNTAGAGHGFIRVYVSNNTSYQGSTTVTGTANVDWIKVEKASISTPWLPNEADYGYVNINCGIAETSPNMKMYANYIEAREFIEW